MTERDRATLDADPLRIQAQLVAAGQDLSREGLVELDHRDVVEAQPCAVEAARTAGTRPSPGGAGTRRRWPTARIRSRAGRRSPSRSDSTHQRPPRRPVVDPARVAGRRGSVGAEKIGRIRASRSRVIPARGRSSAVSPPTGRARRRTLRPLGRCHGAPRGSAARTRPAVPDRTPASAATRSAASPISGSPSAGRGERRHAAGRWPRWTPTPPHPRSPPRPRLDQGRPDDHRGQTAAALAIDGQSRYADAETGLERGVPGPGRPRAPCSCRAPPRSTSSAVRAGVGDARRQHRGGQVCGRDAASPCPAVPMGVRRAATIVTVMEPRSCPGPPSPPR